MLSTGNYFLWRVFEVINTVCDGEGNLEEGGQAYRSVPTPTPCTLNFDADICLALECNASIFLPNVIEIRALTSGLHRTHRYYILVTQSYKTHY